MNNLTTTLIVLIGFLNAIKVLWYILPYTLGPGSSKPDAAHFYSWYDGWKGKVQLIIDIATVVTAVLLLV